MQGAEDSIEILEGVEVGLEDLVFSRVFSGETIKFPAFAIGDDAVNVDRMAEG